MTEQADLHVAVVGAGQAGGRAVAELRARGFAGIITLVGAEGHLPYERPPLSKAYLCDERPQATPVNPAEFYEAGGIVFRNAAATKLDLARRSLMLSDGGELNYDKLVLATGSRPRRIEIAGKDLDGVHYLRGLDDAVVLRERLRNGARVVVVGGGFIGLEVAASARLLGCPVTIIEAGTRLMARGVPPTVSATFAELHLARGCDIRLNTRPVAFEGGDHVERVRLESGEAIFTDLVVVGIGVEPEVDLAREAGLEICDGIVIDEFCRTSDANVLAAGDATNHFNHLLGRRLRLECWQAAQDQASTAAATIMGDELGYRAVPWMWSDQYETNLQVAGMPDPSAPFVSRGDPQSSSYSLFQLDDGVITAAITVNRAVDMPAARKLIARARSTDIHALSDVTVRLKTLLE